MSGCIIPEGYTPRLNVYETQRAIEFMLGAESQARIRAAVRAHRYRPER